MIFLDFFKALGQLGDARFLKVMGKGIGITIALLVAFYVLLVLALTQLGFATWVAESIGISTGWVNGALGIGGIFIMLGLSVFLMVPVASAITSLFLEEVAEAVESVHYPNTSPGKSPPISEAIIESLQFLGIILGANLVALVVFVFVPFLGPVPFWIVNAYLLGREYFTMVARRHLGKAEALALFQQHQTRIWFAGLMMVIPLTVPVLNLIVPTLAVATVTHQFHRLKSGT